MKRRELMIGTGALGMALVAGRANAASGFTDYEQGMIKNALANGETVFVDYAATWCGTCRAQERVISELLKENPAYKSAMKFVRVDWDLFGDAPVTTSRKIPRRSTLLVLRGNEELGRIVAGTSKAQIKQLLDKGLS